MGFLTPYRRVRGKLYRGARIMGNVQPWLEFSGRKIVRRQIHRFVGRRYSRFLHGSGLGGRTIRSLLGLR